MVACELPRRMVRTDAFNQDDVADPVIGAQMQDLSICGRLVPGSCLRRQPFVVL